MVRTDPRLSRALDSCEHEVASCETNAGTQRDLR